MRRDFPQRFACSEDPVVRCVLSSSETLRQRRPNETSQALGKCQQGHWGHNICYIWNVKYKYIYILFNYLFIYLFTYYIIYIYNINIIYIYGIWCGYHEICMVYGISWKCSSSELSGCFNITIATRDVLLPTGLINMVIPMKVNSTAPPK